MAASSGDTSSRHDATAGCRSRENQSGLFQGDWYQRARQKRESVAVELVVDGGEAVGGAEGLLQRVTERAALVSYRSSIGRNG